ncbi:hypothetical protein, partial [Ralstonia sp. A12]|uniref:hypothetical protein n=1 Tax=Ralstonia sp. A12 TaxID=1217052 RepID=UPI001E51C11E
LGCWVAVLLCCCVLLRSQFPTGFARFVLRLAGTHYCGGAPMVWPYLALDGALNFCCKEEKGRGTV